jgi:hypothetical protein
MLYRDFAPRRTENGLERDPQVSLDRFNIDVSGSQRQPVNLGYFMAPRGAPRRVQAGQISSMYPVSRRAHEEGHLGKSKQKGSVFPILKVRRNI